MCADLDPQSCKDFIGIQKVVILTTHMVSEGYLMVEETDCRAFYCFLLMLGKAVKND